MVFLQLFPLFLQDSICSVFSPLRGIHNFVYFVEF
jgi:hypothetical protein